MSERGTQVGHDYDCLTRLSLCAEPSACHVFIAVEARHDCARALSRISTDVSFSFVTEYSFRFIPYAIRRTPLHCIADVSPAVLVRDGLHASCNSRGALAGRALRLRLRETFASVYLDNGDCNCRRCVVGIRCWHRLR